VYPEIFGFVKSYGLMLAISFLVGIFLSVRRGRPHGLSSDLILDLVFAVLVSSIVGVRLFYVLTHLGDFEPWYRVFYIWDGGLTLYGGIAAAVATVWWLCQRRGVAFLRVADILAPGVALGIGITRIGCFLSGCCFGTPTTLSWAVCFPPGSPASLRLGDACVHPSQLYGSIGGFVVAALLIGFEKRSSAPGTTFGRFLALYGLSRFLVDISRYYEAEQMAALGLSSNQWISVLLIGLGTWVLVSGRRAAGNKGGRYA